MYFDDYKKYYKEYEEVQKKIGDYCNLIIHCSRFDLENIGNVLAKVVSEIEGSEFIFKKCVYINEAKSDSPYKRLNLLVLKTISDTSFSTETYMRFRQKRVNTSLYREPNFDTSRNIFVLNKERKLTWFDGNYRTVYHPEFKEYFEFYNTSLIYRDYRLLYKNINFANFSYLENFIDYIIDYRVQNNMKEITEEELNEMANQFINWYRSEKKPKQFVMKLERK